MRDTYASVQNGAFFRTKIFSKVQNTRTKTTKLGVMKLLKIFVLLSSSVVLFENLGAFGEVSAASTTGRRGVLSSAGDDEAAAASFDLLDKEDASSNPEGEEKKMNSWIDFCSSSARELYESPIDPILESEVRNRRRDPPIKITDRGQMWHRAESNVRADARTKSAIFEKRSKSIPLMLFGDSITEYWKLRVNREVLMKTLRVENERDVFVNGISGDETSHALYRLTHGAFPRATVDDIVVMIGTNNLGRAYRLGVEYSNRMKKADEECLSEEQVREVEAYFLAGKKRGRLVPKYALYLLDEDEEEEEGGGGRVAREKHHFGSKNKLGVAIPGVGANVVDAKRLILSTTVSRSVFMKLFDEKIEEKIKVSDAQCLKKETKALAKFLAKSIATVAILPVGKRITREAYQKMQKENFCVVRGYSQKNVKHASEHHIGPSARRSEQTHPV